MKKVDYKLLLIEDNPADSRYIAELLKQAVDSRFIMLQADTLKEGIAAAGEEMPDCILLDLHLPDSSGLETYKKLKEKFEHIPVVILTGTEDEELALQAINSGAQDLLPKGNITYHLLKRSINYAVERNELLIRYKKEIKQRAEAEAAAKKYSDELKLNYMIREKLYSAMTHDLRSPLTGLLGFSELLYDEAGSLEEDEMQEIVNGIYQSSKKFYELFDNFLSWINIEMNAVKFNPAAIPVNKAVHQVLGLYELNIRSKRLRIKTNIPEEEFVYADSNHFELIIRNIFSNAIKFSYPDGVITVSAVSQGKETTVIISDSGKGFIPKDLEVNNKNRRNSVSGTSGEKGSGLGLLLVDEFIKLCKGSYYYESEPGKGAAFYLTFPKEKRSNE